MKKLKNLAIAVLITGFVFPFGNAVAGEGYRGFSIGLIANDMDLLAKGHEYEGINEATKGFIDADDINGYKEDKSFDFPSAFIEYSTGGEWLAWTLGVEHIPGEHALTKKSRTDSADSNTTGNDSDHGERTAVAEVSDLITLYVEPGLQLTDYFGIYGKIGATHMTVDITQSGNNARYQDKDVWGGVYGYGIKVHSPWGIFLKVETQETNFRPMDWADEANKVRAQTSMSTTRMAIGYNF